MTFNTIGNRKPLKIDPVLAQKCEIFIDIKFEKGLKLDFFL